jgi:hypothetical protein
VFLPALPQAPGCTRIDPFRLAEDSLQRLFGFRVVTHRVRIAHPPVIVLLAVLGHVEEAFQFVVAASHRVRAEIPGSASWWAETRASIVRVPALSCLHRKRVQRRNPGNRIQIPVLGRLTTNSVDGKPSS